MTYIIHRIGRGYVPAWGGSYTHNPADAQTYPSRGEAEGDRESREEVVEELRPS